MMHADDSIDALASYAREAFQYHQEGDKCLEPYLHVLAVIEEYREYLCQMSEVSDDGISMPPGAFQRGLQDGLGLPGAECPYPVTSRESWAWSSGHIEGLALRTRERSKKAAAEPGSKGPFTPPV
jgi:hypothetical protein